ncbi:MAG: hypothetical protein GTO18_12140 [Anaerolineales bacterium]|nr:hypothetical protein [Anaerolineales bacterium]
MSIKLQRDIWSADRCSGCGVCVAVCSKCVLKWNGKQHPTFETREKKIGLTQIPLKTCEVCEKFCELCCPRLVNWIPMGEESVISVHSAGVQVSNRPNDVIRSLLIAAMSSDLIDGVVMADMDPWTLEPFTRVATSVDEIANALGTQYLWTPVLSELNKAIFDLDLTRLAIVGMPCVAEGVRQLIAANSARLRPYQERLRFVISTFCTGVYLHEPLYEFLEDGLGVSKRHIQELRVSPTKDEMIISSWDGSERSVNRADVDDATRLGCGRCIDFLGDQADLSLGLAGASEGFATLIVRSHAGKKLLGNALQLGLIETGGQVDEQVLRQAREQKNLRTRAQSLDELRVLSLDALGDPKKRNVVRKQFVRLYGTHKGKAVNREREYVSCGEC